MGLMLACIYLLFLAVPTIFFGYNAFEAEAGSVERSIMLYLASGATGGCVAGMLLPLARTRVGAAFVGIFAVAPYFVFQSGIIPGLFAPRGALSWLEVAWMSAGVGGVAGYLVRHKVFPDLDAIDPP